MNMNDKGYTKHRCKETCGTCTATPEGYLMNDFDLWLAARAILLGTGTLLSSECSGASSLPFLLGKLEEFGHGAFFKAAKTYVCPLNEIQYIQIEKWYTEESKNAYKYDRCRAYHSLMSNKDIDKDELHEYVKAKYPKPKSATPTTTHKRKHVELPIELTLSRPSHRCIYTDKEQWNIIKKYPKRLPERADVMHLMVKNKYVKSRSTLFRHLKESEEKEGGNMFSDPERSQLTIDDCSYLGLGYCGDYI